MKLSFVPFFLLLFTLISSSSEAFHSPSLHSKKRLVVNIGIQIRRPTGSEWRPKDERIGGFYLHGGGGDDNSGDLHTNPIPMKERDESHGQDGKDTIPDTVIQRFQNGYVLRRLSVQDVPVVDSWWPYRDENSRKLIERRIQLDKDFGCCLGIQNFPQNELIACVLRYEGGALGTLHVRHDDRRRGYGEELLRRATEVLRKRGEERVAFIVDGNEASEALFRKVGWRREDPTIKRRTGRRRAKRKWIHDG